MAIALHNPSKLHGRNRGLLGMERGDLRDFARTNHKGLPKRKRKKGRGWLGHG